MKSDMKHLQEAQDHIAAACRLLHDTNSSEYKALFYIWESLHQQFMDKWRKAEKSE